MASAVPAVTTNSGSSAALIRAPNAVWLIVITIPLAWLHSVERGCVLQPWRVEGCHARSLFPAGSKSPAGYRHRLTGRSINIIHQDDQRSQTRPAGWGLLRITRLCDRDRLKPGGLRPVQLAVGLR